MSVDMVNYSRIIGIPSEVIISSIPKHRIVFMFIQCSDYPLIFSGVISLDTNAIMSSFASAKPFKRSIMNVK